MMTTTSSDEHRAEWKTRANESSMCQQNKSKWEERWSRKKSRASLRCLEATHCELITFHLWAGETNKRNDNWIHQTELFFYHFPCLHSNIVPARDRRCSCRPSETWGERELCGDIIAEDNEWVSSLMRSFDTTTTRHKKEKPGHLHWA